MLIIFLIINILFSSLLLKTSDKFLVDKKILDHPNQRSLHSSPKVRGGGIAIILSYFLFIFIAYLFDYISNQIFLTQLTGAIILGVIGWLDDIKGIPAMIRFSCHLISAIILLYLLNYFHSMNILGMEFHLFFFGNILFLFYILWMINLYNFMDGIDGLAISQLIVPSIFISVLFGLNHHYEISILSLIMIASSIFFYKYNWPPSKIFMGDVLSGFIGYYFASITLYLNNELYLSIFIVPVLMSVFIYDATITLFKRILKKEKIWEAHNDHYYQEFAKVYGHKKVTIAVIIIDFILFIPAYIIFKFPELDLFIALSTYLLLAIIILLLKRKFLKDIA